MFTEQDHQQFFEMGIPPNLVKEQLAIFQRGVPLALLDRPCTIGDGITRLSSSEVDHHATKFHHALSAGRVTKFVPASGAASRMFKELMAYRNAAPADIPNHSTDPLIWSSEPQACHEFLKEIKSFAFYDDLDAEMSNQSLNLSDFLKASDYRPILNHLLYSPGLNYARLPKGLIKFHRYQQYSRTPVEEHLVEALAYAKDSTNTIRVHFTLSPEHQELFERHLHEIRPHFEEKSIFLEVTSSQQRAATDTLAVDLENQPFRGADGKLVFRPGGHGALLENLSALQADIVFIKNIDNVVHDRLQDVTNRYKKALGGLLLSVQEQLFRHLRLLMGQGLTEEDSRIMLNFAQDVLQLSVPGQFLNWPLGRQQAVFIQQFNRPVRICGMVPNTGEPGGGPFWVKYPDGSVSLQIVEASQVDPDSCEQQAILRSSTHFNPVDLVCGLRDFQGKPFNLKEFSDPDAGIISRKSDEGRDLKALERPGLWNGAMAHWNTIFVEVPKITFNPVKTIFDLLRSEHQPGSKGGEG